MHILTTTQLSTAIEVLKRLRNRIHCRAEHSAMQLAESPVGQREAGRIGCNAIEQATRIEGVVAQLEEWRTEVSQEGRPCCFSSWLIQGTRYPFVPKESASAKQSRSSRQSNSQYELLTASNAAHPRT